jgi:hypothetical protein
VRKPLDLPVRQYLQHLHFFCAPFHLRASIAYTLRILHHLSGWPNAKHHILMSARLLGTPCVSVTVRDISAVAGT